MSELKNSNEAINTEMHYCYDFSTQTLHSKDCMRFNKERTQFINYNSFRTLIELGYKSCSCCKEQYRKILAEKNAEILKYWDYTYVYNLSARRYHRPGCESVLKGKNIHGTNSYETIIKYNLRPCKICNPDILMESQVNNEDIKTAEEKDNNSTKWHKDDVRKALNRHNKEVKKRRDKLKDVSTEGVKKEDILTLTNTNYGFIASTGYDNFHLPTCQKLSRLNNLRGFRTYNDAVKAGHTPCKLCKPTKDHDVVLSIPTTSKLRKDETIEEIKYLCDEKGYKYDIIDGYFYIFTPAGKWKIKTKGKPIQLAHINLIMNPEEEKYHSQPKRFMSLTDAYYYIKKHDEQLLNQKSKRKRS